jgi:chloride channel protein, CIC family
MACIPRRRDNVGVVGMSACLVAVVWPPVTGILIIFEMTHELAVALMLGALVSQTIGRKMNRENFYDALLTQDGHRLEHVRPPRDLQCWRELPVSAIANFRPVVVRALDPAAERKIPDAQPYQQFPVLLIGKLAGVLTRKEAEAAPEQGRAPALAKAATCVREKSAGALQMLLIEAETHLMVLLDGREGEVIGLLTLHDLLGAEAAVRQKAKEDN